MFRSLQVQIPASDSSASPQTPLLGPGSSGVPEGAAADVLGGVQGTADPVAGAPWTPRPVGEAADGAEEDAAAAPEEPLAPEAAVEAYIDSAVEAIQSGDLDRIREWLLELASSPALWLDGGLIALAVVLAKFGFAFYEKGKFPRVSAFFGRVPTRRPLSVYRILLLLVTWALVLVAELSGLFAPLLRTFSLILTIFIFTTLPSKLLRWKSWMSVVSTTVFVIAALHIVGLLDETVELLDRIAIDLGDWRLSLLGLGLGMIIFLLLFLLADFLSSRLSRRLERVRDVPSNVTVLISKSVRVVLFVVAALVTMNVMGIKITTLAFFGGALGLGLGFGLQKVVSNFVSGVILLLDRSIKPGDVIEIKDTYGWINSLNLRYVSVVTRDNKEHLIPNEDLITHSVVNWSFSDRFIRVRAPFGISYGSDPRLAMSLALECARSNPRVLKEPEPKCNLIQFGDSSVDLELRFWLDDPQKGVGNIRSEILLAIWDAFHEHGVEFPFPQRDVHLRLPENADPGGLLTQIRSDRKPKSQERDGEADASTDGGR